MDVVEVRPLLFMGALPDRFARPNPIEVVVSCVRLPDDGGTYVATAMGCGVKRITVRSFLDDIQPPSPTELTRIRAAAEDAVGGVRDGLKTGVFCKEGRNRSGVVMALALMLLDGCSAAEAIELVRARRNDEARGLKALTNWYFTEALLRGDLQVPRA